MWATNNKDETLTKPTGPDHLIDAARYGTYDMFSEKVTFFI